MVWALLHYRIMGDDGIEMRVVFRDREEGSVYLVLGSLTQVAKLSYFK